MIRGRIIGASAASVIALALPFTGYFEGYIPHTYADPIGIPTACSGHTGKDVTPGRKFTDAECTAIDTLDAQRALSAVLDCVHIDLTPKQAIALTDFTINVGKNALCTSTLAKKANAGAPAYVWCAELSRWTHATKMGVTVELPGLVKRRAAERELCEDMAS